MIELIPSLSVIGGKCVRLSQGDYASMTVYPESPLEVAKRFEDHGIKRLHLIDLDGAKAGKVINYPILELIAGHTDLFIDFGGGLSNDGEIDKAFEYGAGMVNIGSAAANNRERFSDWVITYGRTKIMLSADAISGKVSTGGRQTKTDIDIIDYIEYFYDKSLLYLKCADVSKDGMMQGPALELYKQIIDKFPDLRIFASGGIGSLDDIKRLEDAGVYGAIFGKAFYEGKISLKDMETYIVQATNS
jgi:phosphoribosylformimino-5-aminoimidazole carboxamide ribotide isomerase